MPPKAKTAGTRSTAPKKAATDSNNDTENVPPTSSRNTSPNTSRKRKSDADATPNEKKSDAPTAKRAKKSAQEPLKEKENTATKSKSTTTTKTTKAKTDKEPAKSPKTSTKDKSAKPPKTPEKDKPAAKPAAKPKSKPTSKTNDEKEKYNVDSITLPGEFTATVPIYDTCNDIRTKINAFYRTAPKSISTQANLLRQITASYPESHQPAEGLSAVSLKTFLRKKGPNSGATSPLFYGAYVYFEKLRIKQDKKKSKKREEMEGVWGAKGMARDADGDVPRWLKAGTRFTVDKYGVEEKIQL